MCFLSLLLQPLSEAYFRSVTFFAKEAAESIKFSLQIGLQSGLFWFTNWFTTFDGSVTNWFTNWFTTL